MSARGPGRLRPPSLPLFRPVTSSASIGRSHMSPSRELVINDHECGSSSAMPDQLPFDDASFDRTVSLLILNFVPDPMKALIEMIRVTRPGGTIAAAVWDYGEGMEMLRMFLG